MHDVDHQTVREQGCDLSRVIRETVQNPGSSPNAPRTGWNLEVNDSVPVLYDFPRAQGGPQGLFPGNGAEIFLVPLAKVQAVVNAKTTADMSPENGEMIEYYPYGDEITVKNPQGRGEVRDVCAGFVNTNVTGSWNSCSEANWWFAGEPDGQRLDGRNDS